MQHRKEKMELLRRQFLSLSVGAGAISIALQSAGADTYPSRSVKIIEPIGAGTAGDRYLRSIAQKLENSHHQAFVVENRPGAGTTIGTDYAAHAAPDGYTLLMISTTSTVNETLYAHSGGPPVCACPQSFRTNCACPSKARNLELWFVGPRLELSYGGRTVKEPQRHQHYPRSL